jgi:hypothetical protein
MKDRSVVVGNLLPMLLQFFMQSFVNNSQAMREELRAIYRRDRGRYVCTHTVFFGAGIGMSPTGDECAFNGRAAVTAALQCTKKNAAQRSACIPRNFRWLRAHPRQCIRCARTLTRSH